MVSGMGESRVAVFIDFENIKRAVDEDYVNERVDFQRILDRLARIAKGRILLKRAYADWSAFRDYRSDLLDSATEAVQAFSLNQRGKNGADIRMAVDVMEFVLRQPDVTHVALVTGDSDFTPLVLKLRELGRIVIGVGVRAHTSSYLVKSCDRFVYYEELGAPGTSEDVPDGWGLVAESLERLGGKAVPGSTLKQQIRRLDPLFEEQRYGFGSFLDFLRSFGDRLDIVRPTVGDVTVGPRGSLGLGDASEDEGFFTAPLPASTSGLTIADQYRLYLRENNFRYVPFKERLQIIDVLYSIFYEAEEGEGVSLKEAKDRLHAWFEANRPSVAWDSVNSTVYHLFYTWCFAFERSEEEEGKQLWDRKTTLQGDITSVEDLIAKCERGIVRKLWERDRDDIDADGLNQWLYDGTQATLPRVRELIEAIAHIGFGAAGRA
ncbi:MAG: NYN domain-containing protein [Armatimonadota bacterium]